MQKDKNKSIKSFTDLEAWKESHKLVLLVYKIINEEFPEEEKFGLSSQAKRAVISIIGSEERSESTTVFPFRPSEPIICFAYNI